MVQVVADGGHVQGNGLKEYFEKLAKILSDLQGLENVCLAQKDEHGMCHGPAMGPVVVGHLTIVFANCQHKTGQIIAVVGAEWGGNGSLRAMRNGQL